MHLLQPSILKIISTSTKLPISQWNTSRVQISTCPLVMPIFCIGRLPRKSSALMTNVPEKGRELAATTNQFFDLYNLLSLRCCTNYNICIYSRYNTLSFHHTQYDTLS